MLVKSSETAPTLMRKTRAFRGFRNIASSASDSVRRIVRA
jgi:hypothetical protein